MRFAISRIRNNHTHIAHKVPLANAKYIANRIAKRSLCFVEKIWRQTNILLKSDSWLGNGLDVAEYEWKRKT